MATSSRPLVTDPLRSFKFNVNIPITTTNSNQQGMIRLGFMSVSGLGISIEPLTYREGGDNVTTRKMPGQADFNPITLSRGLFPADDDNWLWMQTLFTAMYGGGANHIPSATSVIGGSPDFRTVVYINVLQHPNTTAAAPGAGPQYNWGYPNQNRIVQASFKLYSAWISSLAYSDLDAGGNAVGIEQMSLNYEGFDMQWGLGQGNTGFVGTPTKW